MSWLSSREILPWDLISMLNVTFLDHDRSPGKVCHCRFLRGWALPSAPLKMCQYSPRICNGLSKGPWAHAKKHLITHIVRKEFSCRCQTGQDKTDPPILHNIKAFSARAGNLRGSCWSCSHTTAPIYSPQNQQSPKPAENQSPHPR